MFVFGILGGNSKRVGNAGIEKCLNCSNWTPMGIYETEKRVSIFFIPVAKFNKEHYIVCPICTAGFPVKEGKLNEILELSIGRPDDQMASEIWNKIDSLFVANFEQIASEIDHDFTMVLAIFSEKVKQELKDKYTNEHLESVLSSYIRDKQEKFNMLI